MARHADIIVVQKALRFVAKPIEVLLSWIERTWFGSVVDAIIGKELVGSALYATLRFVKSIQLRVAQNSVWILQKDSVDDRV